MKFFSRPIFRITVTLVASAFTVCAAWAQAPGRVARLADFTGEVQLANDGEGWHPITRNFPITAGDNVFVSPAGRAELDVGNIQTWIAGGSNVYFDQFDDQHISARLTDGAIALRVRSLEAGDSIRVMTAFGEIAFTRPGFYVVTSTTPGAYASQFTEASLKVRRGEAEFFAPNRAPILVRQAQVLLLDHAELRDSRFYRTQSLDSFEAWATSRDGRIGRLEQRQAGVINPLMIGARDLAESGTWSDSYEYGQVWYPTTVAVDWAPYRYGRWSWVQPWGWTWVDDAAWGFAPFHYGRWVRVGNRWAWSPGQHAARPIYAPALVTFFGGDQWSYGSAGPTFSWVPLGWNEPYAPWYTYTPTYWRELNRPYVRHDTRPGLPRHPVHSLDEPWRPQVFAHASIPGAITAVASAAFLSGRPVAQNYLRNVNERDLRIAPPARMGEVVPYARSAPPATVSTQPVIGAPSRGPAPPIMRDRNHAQPPQITPNTNVMQPRVIQDPNPVVGRRPEPDNRNSRITEPATPMPKERDGRSMPPSSAAPQVQTMQAPQPGYRNVAPQAPQVAPQPAPVRVAPPAAPAAPAVNVAPPIAAPVRVAPPQPPAQVVFPPSTPVAPIAPPPQPPRRVMDNRPAPVTDAAPIAPRPAHPAPQQPPAPQRIAPQPVVTPAPVVAPTRATPPPAPAIVPSNVQTQPAAAPAKSVPTQAPSQSSSHDKGRAPGHPAMPAQPVPVQQ